MYDASNRKDVRRAEKAARQDELNRINYLCAAMSAWQGRAWFHDLLQFCHCFVDTPTWETNKDYFRMGERNVGLRLLSDIMTHCPDEYVTMMKEENARRTERDTAANRATDRASAGEQPGSEDDGWDLEGRIGDSADEPTRAEA